MSFSTWVTDAFESLTPNLTDICSDAANYSLPGWRARQHALVTASGATAAAIPGLHLMGMAADITFLMNRMSVCSYGIGAIIGNQSEQANILEQEDFGVILAIWADVGDIKDATIAKAAADLVGKVGGKQISKLLAKVVCKQAGLLAGRKMAGKVGAKIAARFGVKLGGKMATGFIPFLGAAAGAGINLWFITSISAAAEEWYRMKVSIETGPNTDV